MKKKLQDILDIVTDELGENCENIRRITIEINDGIAKVHVDTERIKLEKVEFQGDEEFKEQAEFTKEIKARKEALLLSSFGQELVPMINMIEVLSAASDKWVIALNKALEELSSVTDANYQLKVFKR